MKSLKKRTGQGHRTGQDLSWRSKQNRSNILDREFKAMILKIFTSLDIRVEDISETINPGIRNNIAEIKGLINKTHI